MSTDIKLSKTQISKKIKSAGSFGSWLGKKALRNVVIRFASDSLPGLVSNIASSAINKFERKVSGKGAVRAGRRFTLFNSNEDMEGIIKIVESLEGSGVLIDGVTETVKLEMKKQEDGFLNAFLAPLAASVVQPLVSSVVKVIAGRGVRRAGRRYMDKKF